MKMAELLSTDVYLYTLNSAWKTFYFQNKSDDLEQTPNSLEDLKFVLTTISDIKAMSLEVEDKIRDIQERYRTLSMYDIEVGIAELSFNNTYM